MSEHGPDRAQTQIPPLDSEVSKRLILFSTVGVVTIVVVAAVVGWGFMSFLMDTLAAGDPPPPALLEARERHLPPSPRLQPEPFADLIELRAEEQRILTSYGWVDELAGIAHVPIDRAMDLLIERGSVGPLSPMRPVGQFSSETAESAAE